MLPLEECIDLVFNLSGLLLDHLEVLYPMRLVLSHQRLQSDVLHLHARHVLLLAFRKHSCRILFAYDTLFYDFSDDLNPFMDCCHLLVDL